MPPVSRRVGVAFLLALTLGVAGPHAAQKPRQPPPKKPATKPTAPAPKVEVPPPPAHVQLTVKYVIGGQETVSTIYSTGERRRVELGTGGTIITQCDLGKAIEVSEKAKAYAVSGPAPSAPAPPPTSKSGGVVTTTTVGTDTGERKEMFGVPVRHIKIVTTTEPSAHACLKKKERVETDGWYADLPQMRACAGMAQPAAPAPGGSCIDSRTLSVTGETEPGYPLSYTVQSFDEAGKEGSRVSVETTDLKRTTLEAGLFEAPKDFAQAEHSGALAALVRRAELEELGTTPKKVGVIRIGVTMTENRTQLDVAPADMAAELLEGLNTAPYEAVPIRAADADAQQQQAKKMECDYLLVSSLKELTTTKPNRVGGLLRKASGDGATTELHEAKLELKLVAVGDASVRLGKTVAAKTGSFTLKHTLGLARAAGRLYFGLNAGMMQTLMNAGGVRGAPQTADPGLGAMMMVLERTKPVFSDERTPEAAVGAALLQSATEVLKALGKK